MQRQQTPCGVNWDSPEIWALVRAALEEDLGAGDLTTSALVAASARANARIVVKQELVLAGLPLAQRVFRALGATVRFEAHFEDGARVPAGAVVAHIEGAARAILSGERAALNLLAHLSGIATLTRKFVDAIAGTHARIRDTRKTTPLLRALEKYAVRLGGGVNHRFGLFAAVLIKENHIALAGGVAEALHRAREFAEAYEPSLVNVIPPEGEPSEPPMAEMTAYEVFRPPLCVPAETLVPGPANLGGAPAAPMPIQIEVRNEAELREALGAGAEAVLLDNVSPAEAARLVPIARRARPACVLEVSGGVTLANVRAYAEAGVDFISVGLLTHSAPAADLSLLVEPLLSK